MKKISFVKYLAVLLALSFGAMLKAQEVVSLTGVVTDSSGAVVDGAQVELINTATNAKFKAVTSRSGVYTISNIPPGPGYTEKISKQGFESVAFAGLYLTVGVTRTQNAQLPVGNVSQTLQVSESADEVALDTTDAMIGNNFDVKMVNNLPVYDRSNPTVLFTLQPGVTADGSVTGARTDQSTVTLDGLDVNDIAAGPSLTNGVVANAPVDSVQEFRGTVAGLLSSSGPGGGGQFQLVTKSGSNQFHGDVNEYHRNTITTANNWFSNDLPIPLSRTALIRNQFGGAIGGPVWKNKLFFFFDYDGSRIAEGASAERAVPLDSYRNNTISYILNSPGCDPNNSRQDTTPNCIGTLPNTTANNTQSVASLDPQHKGFDGDLQSIVQARYPRVNDPTQGDGVNSGGFRFNTPTPDTANIYVARVDYNLNDANKFFARITETRENAINQLPEFPTDPVSFPYLDQSYAYVGGWTWAISPTKVNQVSYGSTISVYDFGATFDPTKTTIYGFSSPFAAPYLTPSSQRRRVPVPMVRDDFNWHKGSHDFGFGGTYKFIKTNSSLVNDFDFPSIGLGNEVLALNAALRPSNIGPNDTGATTTYDSAFAFALGEYNGVSSNFDYDNKGTQLNQGTGEIRRYRFYETELYAGDTWKVTKNLTVSYGVKYMWYTVPYESQGLESIQNFTFDDYFFKGRVPQSTAGISGPTSLPLISYDLGGKANNKPGLYHPEYHDFAPRLAFAWNPEGHPKTVFNGGASMVYDRTVINAINFIQDQSSYLFQNSANNILNTQDPVASMLTAPRFQGSSLASPAVGVSTPAAPAITRPFQPFVGPNPYYGSGPYGLAANEFQTVIDPNLKNPYSIAFNAGFQHEFPNHFILKAAYAGRLGRRLIAQVDASQLVDFTDPSSGQKMSTAFANITKALRAGVDPSNIPNQPWFENQVQTGGGGTQIVAQDLTTLAQRGDFADTIQALANAGLINQNVGLAAQLAGNTFITNKGSSNYHGMLVTLSRNLANGLQFDVNYTWSHSIDNTSQVANSIASNTGVGFICDAVRPRECRADSDFDTRHIITADFLYTLPFGRGAMFASTAPRWVDELIGGWNLDGIPAWHTGRPFTPTSDAFVAGYANNAPAIFTGSSGQLKSHLNRQTNGAVYLWNNSSTLQQAFTGPVGFQLGQRNLLRGPRTTTFDAGLGKTFPIFENINLKFRADAFNVLNHPVFLNPVSDITSSQFGQITATATSSNANGNFTNTGSRVMQFALRVEF